MKGQSMIVVEQGVGKKIAQLFGVTGAMVTKALRGKGTTELARKIRYVAITQYGGKEMVEMKTGNKKD